LPNKEASNLLAFLLQPLADVCFAGSFYYWFSQTEKIERV
jgi:hypothetical protein